MKHTDSDWQESVQHASGVINYRNSTKRLVAFASCEAELYAPHKEAPEDLVIRCLATGVGGALDIVINTDSGEAPGAVNRRDVGKLRHRRTQELRPQSAI